MFKVRLREEQRPVLLRDGKGGPMRVVTASNWVNFQTIPEFMIDDCSLEIEEIGEAPAAVEPAPAATEPEQPKPRTRRRRRKTPEG